MPRFEYERASGSIFFNEEAAHYSHFGSFADDTPGVWGDEQISDFIRGGRPDLFKTLQRLPVLAEQLPLPVNLESQYLTPDERVLVNQTTLTTERDTPAISKDLTATAQCQHTKLYRYSTLKLQHKRYIQAHVINGHGMILQCAHQFGRHFPCSAPDCNEAVGRGGFFVTLRSTSGQGDIHYSLQCLENLMGEQNVPQRTQHEAQYYAVDGAAETRPDAITMPYNLPSNAVENRRLRQKRTEEIDEILHGVGKRRQAPKHSLSDTDDELSMSIYRPDNPEDIGQRYKKQRLTAYDQGRDRLASRRQEQEHSQHSDPQYEGQESSVEASTWDNRPRLICYCREPEKDSDLIQCGNEFCLVGWFHVKCCMANPSLLSDRKFFCDFCTDRATSTDSELSATDVEAISPDDTLAQGLDEAPTDQGVGFGDDEEDSDAQEDSDAKDDNEDYGDEEEEEDYESDDLAGSQIAFSSPEPTFSAAPSPGGFTPINQRYRSVNTSPLPFNLDGAVDTRLRPVATYRTPPAFCADFATLADLAPFMSYDLFPDSPTGLQEEDVLNFEAWRCSMPVSRILAIMEPGGAVMLEDTPKGSRKYLKKRAKEWVDRLLFREHKKLDGSLSTWVEGKF